MVTVWQDSEQMISRYEDGANKCVAHLRHESSYSPGPDTTLTSPGSSSNERLTRHTAANTSPGSHSGDHHGNKNGDKNETQLPEAISSSSSSRAHSSTLAWGPF